MIFLRSRCRYRGRSWWNVETRWRMWSSRWGRTRFHRRTGRGVAFACIGPRWNIDIHASMGESCSPGFDQHFPGHVRHSQGVMPCIILGLIEHYRFLSRQPIFRHWAPINTQQLSELHPYFILIYVMKKKKHFVSTKDFELIKMFSWLSIAFLYDFYV